jgi:hypothetical protein
MRNKKNNLKVLGWSVGQNKWGDETGTYHVIVAPRDQPDGQCFALCKPTLKTSGQVTVVPHNHVRLCNKCRPDLLPMYFVDGSVAK